MRVWGTLLVCLSLPSLASEDERLEEAEEAAATVTESVTITVPAKPIGNKPPKYPAAALRRGYEAWIYLSYCIDESGVPQNISVLDSTGDSVFERHAASMLEDWRFEPALVDGKPTWQSNNQQYVYFAIESDQLGADRGFIRSYRKFRKLIDEDKLEEADTLFQKLYSSKELSLYESSKLWAQRVRYELKKGDLYMVDLALHRATASKGQWIEAESYLSLLALRVRVEVKLEKYSAAISAYRLLQEEVGEEHPIVVELQPLMEQVRAVVEGDRIIKASAEIRRKGECFSCDDSYSFDPVRPLFGFTDIEGQLTSIRMRCDHHYYESDISDLVEWHIPETWGDCSVEIYGKPGTTFSVLLFPDA